MNEPTRVTFEEYQSPAGHTPQASKMVQLFMTLSGGIIKNERQAVIVMIGFVAIAVAILITTILSAAPNVQDLPPTPYETTGRF